MTRIPPMLGEQHGLFPEPDRVHVEPNPPRWTVLEPDDEDDGLDDEDEELIAVEESDDLESLRENYEDAYLHDGLTGQLHEPYGWPDDDAVDSAVLHVIHTLAANDFLAALADYQNTHNLAPVTP